MRDVRNSPLQSSASDFSAALRNQAEEDAEFVGEFLREQGIVSEDGRSSVGLPAEILLGLGLAFRFRSWELQQITVHLEAGFPSGAKLLERVTAQSSDDRQLAEEIRLLAVRRIELLHTSFLWSVPDDSLQLDLAIVADSDESFLESMADFLIEHLQGGT